MGAVVTPHGAGWSTLAAMQVPEEMLEAVAEFCSAFPEVNHKALARASVGGLVVRGRRRVGWQVGPVLREMEYRTSLPVLDLP